MEVLPEVSARSPYLEVYGSAEPFHVAKKLVVGPIGKTRIGHVFEGFRRHLCRGEGLVETPLPCLVERYQLVDGLTGVTDDQVIESCSGFPDTFLQLYALYFLLEKTGNLRVKPTPGRYTGDVPHKNVFFVFDQDDRMCVVTLFWFRGAWALDAFPLNLNRLMYPGGSFVFSGVRKGPL
jgi:hypothetical protein